MTIRAIYENGVFRPTESVDLPEKSEVVFEPRVVHTDKAPTPAMARIYEILSRTYDTDQPDLVYRSPLEAVHDSGVDRR
ncbi:MAG TPA: antitoxin family protein [Tepidisphaeraceae bacterium]|jgi:predicted DNA-binding antitoxin AbrB/MazE fold protein